jgi:hypothetical protein
VNAATGIITTVAGGGNNVPGDGGPATSASLSPLGVAVDAAGNLFIADRGIRKVAAATGIITTVAGTGSSGFSGDGGPATSASLAPYSVAVDAAGNLFIADTNNQRVRKVAAATGIITTVAGTGAFGFSGDGGPATSASLRNPEGVAVDAAGNLFIADSLNHRVRKVATATGIITTVAGSGTFGSPRSVAVDAAGNLFIAEGSSHRVRKVAAATGIITSLAGTGEVGFSGDGGPALSASLRNPEGVAVDAAGNLFIVDAGNQRVRKVAAVAAPAPGVIAGTTISGTVTLQGRTATFPAGVGHRTATVTLSPGGVSVTVNIDGSFGIPDVAAGTYTLTASASGYVSRQRTNVVVGSSAVTPPSTQLRCGLVNSDNFVNINDITATVASFGKTLANRVDAQGRFVDQNGDRFVNIDDITCVVSGFGSTSPLPWE